MEFTWDYRIDDFLFQNFNIDSLKKCLLVVFIVFCLAYLSHIIRVLQTLVEHHFNTKWLVAASLNQKSSQNVNSVDSEQVPLVQSLRIPTSNTYLRKQKFKKHCIQSLLYLLNLIIGYFLMMIAMNFYAGHFIAIILGFTFGYYILNVRTPEHNVLLSMQENGHSQRTIPTASRRTDYEEIS